MAIATRTISGLYDGATTAELDRLSIQTAAEMTAGRAGVLAARRPAAVELHRQGGARPADRVVQPGRAARPPRGADRRRDRRLRRGQRPQARPRRRPRRTTAGSSTSACGPSTTATCCATPRPGSVIETPQYFLLRVACGLSHTPQEAIAFYRLMASLAYLPSSPTLFNSGTRHTQMSSCYLVDSPAGRARLDLRPLRAGGQAVEVRWWHWDLVVAGPLARRAHPRHQRPLQRHRPVAAHPRLVGRRRSTRAAAARAPPASTSSRGTPTSRSSSSCATTPARTPAAPTTSTSPTGSPTSSCAASRPTSSGA